MEKTVVCYLIKNDKYLMLYRNKKKNDPNKDKWITVGGHIEKGETNDQACIREVFEETGYKLLNYKHLGKVIFSGDFDEEMYVYVSHEFSGVMHECDEGELAWFTKEEVLKLDMFEGDFLFINKVFNEEEINMNIIYENKKLKKN